MANLTNEITTKVNGAAHDFKGIETQLEKMSRTAGEKAGVMASQVADTTADYVKTSREYIRANPVKGVAIAAATGVVVGSLLTFMMRSRRA